MSLLSCKQIGKSFPGVRALDQVNIHVDAGEVLALCGENGAGKSTLIKIISGIYPHASYDGTLQIQGQNTYFEDIQDAEAAGIAVIYQELALIPRLSVAENIYLGHEPKRGLFVDWERLFSDAQALLKRYHIDIDVTLPVSQLGVGQQQLVEIAKALAKDSKILLLDEPSAALTEEEVQRLLDIIRQLREQGTACIYISHKLDEVFAIADRISILRDGQEVHSADAADLNEQDVIRHMVGREITDMFPYQAAQHGACLLQVQQLHVRDAQTHEERLTDITLNVHAGEVLGIGGLMGAGRSELLLHLMGMYGQRTQGQVLVHGQELAPGNTQTAIKSGMILVSEDRKRYGLFLSQSLDFNLSIAALDTCSRGGFIHQEHEQQRNLKWSQQLQVKTPSLDVAANTLSGGNQQKIVLGKSLMLEPQIVLLDEPTRGIDVGAKVEIYEIINRLKQDGKAIILISSEMPELMGMSDRITVLCEGRISGSFTREDFNQEHILQAAMQVPTVSSQA